MPIARPWAKSEDTKLRELCMVQGMAYSDISFIIGRGRSACIARARRMGLNKIITAEQKKRLRSLTAWNNLTEEEKIVARFERDHKAASRMGRRPDTMILDKDTPSIHMPTKPIRAAEASGRRCRCDKGLALRNTVSCYECYDRRVA